MKYLLIIALVLLPIVALAVTGDNTRFDSTSGTPSITADNTNTCNDTAVARFDTTTGIPNVVHDATANCTVAVAASNQSIHKFEITSTYKVEIPTDYAVIIQ